jgi:hypothetical protein
MKWTQVFTVVALYAAVASPRAIRSPTQDALAPVPASLTSYPSFPSAALFVDKPTAGKYYSKMHYLFDATADNADTMEQAALWTCHPLDPPQLWPRRTKAPAKPLLL